VSPTILCFYAFFSLECVRYKKRTSWAELCQAQAKLN
jgi:hypothetical protein